MWINFSLGFSRQPACYSRDLSQAPRRAERKELFPAGLPSLARWDGPILEPRILPPPCLLHYLSSHYHCFVSTTFSVSCSGHTPCSRVPAEPESRLVSLVPLPSARGCAPAPGPLAGAPWPLALMLSLRGFRGSTTLLGSTHLSSQDLLLLQH